MTAEMLICHDLGGHFQNAMMDMQQLRTNKTIDHDYKQAIGKMVIAANLVKVS